MTLGGRGAERRRRPALDGRRSVPRGRQPTRAPPPAAHKSHCEFPDGTLGVVLGARSRRRGAAAEREQERRCGRAGSGAPGAHLKVKSAWNGTSRCGSAAPLVGFMARRRCPPPSRVARTSRGARGARATRSALVTREQPRSICRRSRRAHLQRSPPCAAAVPDSEGSARARQSGRLLARIRPVGGFIAHACGAPNLLNRRRSMVGRVQRRASVGNAAQTNRER